MPNTTLNLDHFNFLELLQLLAAGGKTGVLSVTRGAETFECALEAGRVRELKMGARRGNLALVALLSDPRGQFHFDEGRRAAAPSLDASMDEVALEALAALPEQPLPFDGPGKLATERLDQMTWTVAEQRVLDRIEAQQPLAEVARDPEARRLISRLDRLGLLRPRRSRTARLTVTLAQGVRGVVVVDSAIVRRWSGDLGRPPAQLAVRDDAGQTYTFALRMAPDLGHQLQVPTELLMRTGLRAGMSVLVKPL